MHSLFDANLAIIIKTVMGLHSLEAILSFKSPIYNAKRFHIFFSIKSVF